jgi:hypothetical protein
MIDEVTGIYEGTLSRPFIEFARRQLVNATLYKGPDKRTEGRHPMMLPALVVPIDERNQPIDDVFEVVTRDVASTSIGLFHQEPLNHKRLALHMFMAGTEVNLVLQIVWKGPMGPFYGSAGWYVDRLEEFPGFALLYRD